MNRELERVIKAHLESGETLIHNGNLTLEDDELLAIPFLYVRGDLVLRNMSNLHKIWSLVVTGNCLIEGCDFLKELPSKCKIGKTLTLRNNILLADLGEKLSCHALEVDFCLSVTIMELGIENCSSIAVKDCRALELVTQKQLTWVPSEVLIQDCGVVSIPSGFKVGTSLKVIDCKNLESVGSEVFSGGDMEFNGCVCLSSIGSKLFVARNLTLKNTNLAALPEDMTIADGFLEVEGSSHINNLKQIQEAGVDVRVSVRR